MPLTTKADSPKLLIVTKHEPSIVNQLTDAINKLGTQINKSFQPAVLVDTKEAGVAKKLYPKSYELIITNTKSDSQLHRALLPISENAIGAVCRSEATIPLFKRVISHMPYILSPTESSLDWATNKILMRRRLYQYNKKITPTYTVVTDYSPEALTKIEKKVGFPLVVKPAGLAASLLVSVCYHPEELETTLRKTFRKIKKVYKEKKGRGEPTVLVEQLMEGSMYSVDAYIDSKGKPTFCPLVHVKTGRAVGFDDFFGYQRLTPVKLLPHKAKVAQDVASQAIKALGMRNIMAHIELIKTERGWKIVELAPRMGGFRHEMYKLSYGFDHTLNDILIRLGKKPKVLSKPKGYTAVLQFYGQKEGRLESLKGVKKIRKLASFHSINIKNKKGDLLRFAKHGGGSVFDLVLFNKERSKLLADIRRTEQNSKIVVRSSKSKNL